MMNTVSQPGITPAVGFENIANVEIKGEI